MPGAALNSYRNHLISPSQRPYGTEQVRLRKRKTPAQRHTARKPRHGTGSQDPSDCDAGILSHHAAWAMALKTQDQSKTLIHEKWVLRQDQGTIRQRTREGSHPFSRQRLHPQGPWHKGRTQQISVTYSGFGDWWIFSVKTSGRDWAKPARQRVGGGGR